jgi:hypothetical protein
MPTSYYEYGEWIDWHPEPFEMICSRDSTGLPTYIDPVPINGVVTDCPIEFHSGTEGDVHYTRAFAGEYPQENGGLRLAFEHRARYGNSETVLWPDEGDELEANLGTVSSLRGASYELIGDGEFTAPGIGVHAYSTVSGWTFDPAVDLFDSWTDPWFRSSAADSDAALIAEYLAAQEETSPGDEWFPVIESFFPVFVGFEIAVDEIDNDHAVYGGTPPSGTIYVGTDASGLALTLDPETEDGVSWEGPGAFSATLFAAYSGGVGEWTPVPDEWVPTQNPATGQLIPAEVPKIVLNTYIDGLQAEIDGEDSIIPFVLMPNLNGFDVYLAKGRQKLTFAVKALWKPPRFRWGREVTISNVPPRRIRQRSDGDTHGATRVLGGGNTVQSGNRVLGTIL